MTLRALCVALCLSAVARADPLATCKEKSTRPGERDFRCAGFRVGASAETPAFGEQAVLDMVMNALRTDHQYRVEQAEVSVGGEKRKGFRYRNIGGDEVAGVGAIVPASKDMIRAVFCEERRPSQCDAALTPFAASLKSDRPPAFEARGLFNTPKFLGHDVPVNDGCETKADGVKTLIRCGPANVSWLTTGPDDPKGDAWIYEPIKRALASQGQLTERQVPCLVGGTKASCHDLDIARPNGVAWHATAVMAEVEGQRVWVQCNVSGPREKALPEPCAQILKFQ